MKAIPAFRFLFTRICRFALIMALFIASFFMIATARNSNTAGASAFATVGGCPLFPTNNIWNYDISQLPAHPNSANYIASIGLSGHLHPDFGAGLYGGGPIGIPFVVVPGGQPYVPVSFDYASESDPGPYPIPPNAPIEGGSQSSGDRHVIVVDSGTCKLYEMFASYPQKGGSWHAGSGAVWDLNSNALRPATWTSADAAGLPMLPGLVTYDEVASGVINHALRFTVNETQNTFLWSARHQASSNSNPNLPPMGLRLRLKASVDISSFSHTDQIILTALKQYGMFVADNGSSWFISGAPDNRWNNDDLLAISAIPGSDFEAVDESALQMSPNSGQVAGSPTFPTIALSPTRTPTASASATHTPQVALTPEIAEVPKNKHDTGNSNTSMNLSVDSSGIGNTLPLVLGSIAFVLAILGVALCFKWAKKSK